jgi:hypothetical protein
VSVSGLMVKSVLVTLTSMATTLEPPLNVLNIALERTETALFSSLFKSIGLKGLKGLKKD